MKKPGCNNQHKIRVKLLGLIRECSCLTTHDSWEGWHSKCTGNSCPTPSASVETLYQ